MKKLCLTSAIAVFLLFCLEGVQAQITQSKLNQIELMKQYLGTFQANHGKDTVEIWTGKQYGPQAFILEVSYTIKGQKVPMYINNIFYDSNDGKLKGFQLWANGDHGSWIGAFTSETKFDGVMAQDFVAQPTWGRFENIYKNLNESDWAYYNSNGVKTIDLHFTKVK
jgi:hypothetical protein